MNDFGPMRRGLVVDAFRKATNSLPGYTFHRGPILWGKWDFAANPKTLAMFFADYDLIPEAQNPFRRGTLVFEILTKIPEGRVGDDLLFDDSGLDALSTEFLGILRAAAATMDANGEPIIVRIHNDPPPGVREMADQNLGVQGIEVTVTIDY